MMLKNIWIVSIFCIVLVQSFATDQDVCIPCNKQTFNSFLSCLNTKLNQNNFLSRTSEADIADTKDSIIFAVDALHSNKEKFKERVMMSVLATEMCGLLTNDGSISQYNVIAQALSGFVRECYIDETGEVNETFFYEFESLVDSVLKSLQFEKNALESDDRSQSSANANSRTFDEDFQSTDESRKPINYAYSNAEVTNFEPNNLNRQQNLLPQNLNPEIQQNGMQTPIGNGIATSENQNKYIPVTWQQIGSPSEIRDYSFAESEANYGQSVQPTYKRLEIETVNANRYDNDYDAIQSLSKPQNYENQNSYNGATVANSVYRNNAVFQQDIPPQKQMDTVQPAVFSSVIENKWNSIPSDNSYSSTIQQPFSPSDMKSASNTGDVSNLAPINVNNPQELIQGNGFLNTLEQIKSYPTEQYSNQYQKMSSDQNNNSSDSNKLAATSSNTVRSSSTASSKEYGKKSSNSQKKNKKSKKQQNIKPVALNQNNDDSPSMRPIDYSISSASIQENSPTRVQSTTSFENVRNSAVTTTSSNAYSTDYQLPTKTPNKKRLNSQKKQNKSKKKKYVTTTLPKTTKSESLSNSASTQDFQRSSKGGYSKSKALEFGETIFVALSKNEQFCKIFNKDTSNANAQYQAFEIVSKGMIQCGYSSISEEVAYSCRDATSSVQEGSTSQVYSQTIAKAVMIYFYKNDLIENNNKNQAKRVALAMIEFLPKSFYPYDYETLSEQSAQNQENPKEYSDNDVTDSSQASIENTSSGDTATNADGEMYEYKYNIGHTGKEAEVLDDKSRSYSKDSNYEYVTIMNDEDRNYEDGDREIITIGSDDEDKDYECDEEVDDNTNHDRTNILISNNEESNRIDENIAYADSNRSDSFNEGNKDSNKDLKAESLTTNKPPQKKNLNSKKNKEKKRSSTKIQSSQSQNPTQSSNQGKTKEKKNEATSQSKNSIVQLQSAAISSISGGEFDYELFMKTLSRLIAERTNSASAWSDEGRVFDVLMESIVALTQLLAQN